MRKLMVLMVGMAMLASLTAPGVSGQSTPVGDLTCTNTSNYLPWNAYYGYSESQYIIPATELLAAGIVSGDMFYRMGWWQCSGTFTAANNVIEVYLQEVGDPYPQVCTAPIYPNGTLVYSGPMQSVTTPGENSFDCSTVYTWGGQNLVVTVCEIQPNYSSTTYWGVNLVAGNGINRYRDSAIYDCNLTTAESTANCRGGWPTTFFDVTGLPTPTPTPITACVTTVSSFPYTETFETGTFGAWLQATWDELNWTLDQGGTPSTGTGPVVDHTTGTATGWYAYLETSTGSTGNAAILYGVCFDTTGMTSPLFSFWYHMYGATMGTLDVQITLDGGGTWTTVWTLSGDQGDTWYNAAIDLSAYAGSIIGVQFVGYRGTSFTGDMAIDDLFLGEPGVLQGTVTDAGGPVVGALVSIDGTSFGDVTDGTGFYSIPIFAGTYDMTVTAAGHNDATATGVVVNPSSTTTQDFYMTAPEIAVTPLTLTSTLDYGNTETQQVTITNTGDGPLDYNIGFTNFSGLDAMWDMLAEYAIGTVTGDTQILGCEFIGGDLWFTGANSAADPNNIYRVSADGTTLLNTYPQPAAVTGWGMRDLAHDGTYLYGGADSYFVQIDPTDGSVIASVPNTLGIVIRALAYDPASGHFYTGDFASNIIEFSFDGASVTSVRAFNLGLTAKYGMAWDDVSSGGPYLWIFDQTGAVTGTSVFQADVSTVGAETLTGVSYEIPLGTGQLSQIAGGMFLSTDFITGKIVLGCQFQSDTDLFQAIELGDYATWISATPSSGTIPSGGGSAVIDVLFDSAQVGGPGVYTADMVINNNDGDENPTIVDLTMIVTGGGDLEGYVYDSNSVPIVGATVEITAIGRSATTDGTGFYQILQALPGTYDVTASATGYVDQTVTGVVIVASNTTTQDFNLTFADINVIPDTYEKWMMPDTTATDAAAVTVQNNGSASLNWNAAIVYTGGPVDSVSAWSNVTPVTTAIQWPFSTVYQGKLYYIAGLYPDGVGGSYLVGTVNIFDIATSTWSTGASMPTMAFGGVCVGDGGMIYCIGGFGDLTFNGINAVQIYDIATDTWSTGTTMPTARGGNAGGLINGKIYSVGGSTTSSFPTDNVCYEYDIATDTWATLDDAPIANTYGISLGGGCAYQGLLYVGCHFSSLYSGWYVLDPTQPSGSQWTQLTAPPATFGSLTPIFVPMEAEGFICGFGAGNGWTATGTTYAYDPAADTWTNLNLPMTVVTLGGAGGGENGTIWYYGGTTGSGPTDPPPFMSATYNALTWLDMSSKTGMIAPGGSAALDLLFDSAGLVIGDYTANVIFSSNDVAGTTETLAVTLHVSNVTPTPTVPPVVPATGPAGLAVLLLALGGLLGIGSLPRRK
ncbi:carboxypeptidase regulatory-like domain-containing protein [bacterium]|nr:carboxypeptidase regulatory-like domain-containing protein [candidate division CSSED10-310 bacterium]